MHRELDYSQSEWQINELTTTDSKHSLLIVGGESGYGNAIKKHFLDRCWRVNSAGLSNKNHIQINLEIENDVIKLAKEVKREKYDFVIITAATDFLGSNMSEGFSEPI